MKRLICIGMAVLIFTPAYSQDNGAETSDWDISGWSFHNYCTGEWVRPFPGETIKMVMRVAPGQNSFHRIAFANGHVSGYGVMTGDAYSLTLSMSGVINGAPIINVTDGNGVVKFRAHTFITSMADPTVGVSSRDTNIQVVLKDGVPEVVHLDTNVTGDCSASN